MTSPLDPLSVLGQRMRDLAKSIGCDMDAFVVIPDLDGNSHLCQVVFVLPELEEKPEHPENVGVDVDAEAAALLASIEEYETAETKKSEDEDAIERLLNAREKLRQSRGDEDG